jgi:hypothetical protein
MTADDWREAEGWPVPDAGPEHGDVVEVDEAAQRYLVARGAA